MKRNRLLSIYLSLIIVLLCGCEVAGASEPNIEEEETYSSVTNPKDSECSDEYNCTGQFLSDDTFNDPVATAEKLLSQAFSFAPDAYASTVSQNDDFWNITFEGERNYVVELTPELPYPQTLYEYRSIPHGSYGEGEVPSDAELVDIAEEFLFNVYALNGDTAKIDVFNYGSKLCVQFIMSDTHIFQVRIHKGDFKPSGILFFDNIEAAEKAAEKAIEIQKKVADRDEIRNKYNVDEISALYNVDPEVVIDVIIEGPTLDKFSPFVEIMDRCASIDRRTFIQGLSYDLPEGLRLGEYDSTIEAGGFLLLPYAYFNEGDSAPEYWKSAGSISCFPAKGAIEWANDEINDVNLHVNHTSYEKIGPIKNMFWPAYLLKAEHDLMTHPELMEYEESGSPDNIDTTSEYWYVVFAEPETAYGLLVSLATREYTKEDMITFASSFEYTS